MVSKNKPNEAKRSEACDAAEGRGDVRQTRRNKVDLALGVLNGAIGDYLHSTDNGLAIPMALVRRENSGAQRTQTRKKIAILVHGLMMTADTWTFTDGSGDDYGTLLERDFGYSPIYVHYNSGRAISDNGAELAELLEDELKACALRGEAIDEILLLGFSMGGLVLRNACHVAATEKMNWLTHVRRAFYVGTPHLGSPWERAGRVLTKILRTIPDPYTRLAADLGDLRSKGIKDLGDPAHPIPLLSGIDHHLIAGFLNERLAPYFGDGMVPLPSGTNAPMAPMVPMVVNDERVRVAIVPKLAHLELTRDRNVYTHIAKWAA